MKHNGGSQQNNFVLEIWGENLGKRNTVYENLNRLDIQARFSSSFLLCINILPSGTAPTARETVYVSTQSFFFLSPSPREPLGDHKSLCSIPYYPLFSAVQKEVTMHKFNYTRPWPS